MAVKLFLVFVAQLKENVPLVSRFDFVFNIIPVHVLAPWELSVHELDGDTNKAVDIVYYARTPVSDVVWACVIHIASKLFVVRALTNLWKHHRYS